MWHRLITYNSLESTRGISQFTSGTEVEREENGEENAKVSETEYLWRVWLMVAGKRSASWVQHVVKGN